MKYSVLPILILFVLAMTQPVQSQTPTYQNPDAAIEDRVEDLLNRMTVYEKIGQMTQLNITTINPTGKQADVELVEEKARDLIGNHHIGSFLNGEAVPPEQWFRFTNQLTRLAMEESRLGIPIIYGIDHVHGANYLEGGTIFPHNINLGATFNPQHSYNTGWVTAYETADLGHHWNFAPILDIGVNPLWPRIYETFGEDPRLAARMGESYINGYQRNEEIEPYNVAATAKHFLGYSDPKSGWDRSPAYIPKQAIHEFHRPSFQAAVDAGIKTVMLNSGEINGIPVHGSYELVTELLRDEMGFDGVVVTDWADIEKLVDFHFISENFKEATFRSVMAGIDMSMTPLTLEFNEAMQALVDEGRITEDRIDESVRRILRLKFELGLFEHPYPSNERLNRIGTTESKVKALEAARESIVLLRNKNGVLPVLNPTRILVAGPSADSKRNLAGGWTLAWQGANEERYPDDMMTILDALRAEYPDADIEHVTKTPSQQQIDAADLIVYAGGEEPYTEFVGNISDLTLPQNQLDEISRLSESATPLVLVLVQGRPRLITSVEEKTDAILHAGLPGFQGANAIAEIISGAVNPSGKLPISYPESPSHFTPYNHKPSANYDFDEEDANQISQVSQPTSLYPFGHGLSYTTFTYSDLRLSKSFIGENGSLSASVAVTNAGNRAGMESVLWFITDHVGTITRPVEELAHFEKIALEPGETKRVQFEIQPSEQLSYPDRNGQPILEEGYFTVKVGELTKEFRLEKNKDD
ncbi:glycoside hydrolase family 3 N-terminal domain-containing protein [Rhodohalobacter sp. 8-1]|uniref:glycoside hydrolase family 3 N-terminal domain-containing protein n=1 Tax=Rhodohalobacter sp. 8-1 TaxID=3131972 RepID=UPI0030EF890E